MKIEAKVKVVIDVDELSESLSRETLFDFITDLDEAVGSWAFTLKLADHFDELRRQYEREHHTHFFSEDGDCSCGESLQIVS